MNMFSVKKINVDSLDEKVILFRLDDSKEIGLTTQDKVKVFCSSHKNNEKDPKNFVICSVEIVDDKEFKLKKKQVCLYEKTYDKLELDKYSKICITSVNESSSLEIIKKRFRGEISLSYKHFREILKDIVDNRFSQIETTFFVLSGYSKPFTDNEVLNLTKAMVDIGTHLNFKNNKGIVVDKHCIGGVPNNRTSILVIPIMASLGYMIPKTSSRSITSPAGTADTVEVLCNVNLSTDKMVEVVKNTNGCLVWGGSVELSPADDQIIHVEHPLKMDFEGQMIASVLSKKVSAGSTHVLIDIPYGENAKVNTLKKANHLKKRFFKIGTKMGLKMKVVITQANDIIGNGVGPYLEAMDVLKVLNQDEDRPKDLETKAIEISSILLEFVSNNKNSKKIVENCLKSKLALKKFNEILESQGIKKVPQPAKFSHTITSKIKGKITNVNISLINKICFDLGCPKDSVAGIYAHKKLNDSVLKNEPIYTIYSSSDIRLDYVKVKLRKIRDLFEIE